MKENDRQGQPANAAEDTKTEALEAAEDNFHGTSMTTDLGLRVASVDDSLKAGARGPTLLEDFRLRERITRFDHERIPERVVHARGSAAHGYFQVYESMAEYTQAKFLQDPSVKTPVFVRFSTVVGSRGSADTVRDVRGFATKFYTEEGVFDLVGNNIPVFFIQDGIKFPDVVHAVKPEPHHEMPQASSAHDTFWDFASLTPETTHMLMWVLSDRALPRSYSMMEGFGVHTFRLVNASGKSRFVKFHWKPILGVHSLVWDEVQKLAGKDPDFNRRDLWEAIESGKYPEYELGVQIVEEEDEHAFDFDLLDPTKIIPEELVPVKRIGKMVLNRNPDNFFSETEQVAFCPANVVPGIDFTNDPLLQARLFSYLDTQLTRLGGPNFNEIPINRPTCPVTNYNQDGFMQQRVPKGRVNYHPNSLGRGCPVIAGAGQGAFVPYAEKIEARKIIERSESFKDHYSQATLFWNSMSKIEKEHIITAARFELGKVETMEVRERMIERFANVDIEFARRVAEGVGVAPPTGVVAAVKKAADTVKDKVTGRRTIDRSPALSQENTAKGLIKGRKIGVLASGGVSGAEVEAVKTALLAGGAAVEVVSVVHGTIATAEGKPVKVDKTLLTAGGSIVYDALYVPGGRASVDALLQEADAIHYINEAFKHAKPIGATGEGVDLLLASLIKGVTLAAGGTPDALVSDQGVVTGKTGGDAGAFAQAFVQAIGQHRHWDRLSKDQVPA